MGYRVPAPHQASVVPGLRWGEGPQEFRKSDLEEQGPHIMVQVGDEEGSSQPAPHPPLAPANCGGGSRGRLAVNLSWDIHFPHLPSRGLGLWARLDRHRPGGVSRLQKDLGPPAFSQRPCPPPRHKVPLALLFCSIASVSASLPRGTEGRGRTLGPVFVLCTQRRGGWGTVSEQRVSDPQPRRAPGCAPSFWWNPRWNFRLLPETRSPTSPQPNPTHGVFFFSFSFF